MPSEVNELVDLPVNETPGKEASTGAVLGLVAVAETQSTVALVNELVAVNYIVTYNSIVLIHFKGESDPLVGEQERI